MQDTEILTRRPAEATSMLAGLVRYRLTGACTQAAGRDDRRACGAGTAAAADVRFFLLAAGCGA